MEKRKFWWKLVSWRNINFSYWSGFCISKPATISKYDINYSFKWKTSRAKNNPSNVTPGTYTKVYWAELINTLIPRGEENASTKFKKPTYLGTPIMFQSVKLMKNETIIGNNLKTIRPTRHGSIIHHAILAYSLFSIDIWTYQNLGGSMLHILP